MPTTPDHVKAYLENWRTEAARGRLYRRLAEVEKDERRKSLLVKMAESEEGHAELWAQRLREVGIEPPEYHEALGERLENWLAGYLGVDNVLRRITQEEARDAQLWEQQAKALDPAGGKLLQDILPDELHHVQVLKAMSGPAPRERLDTILNRERWHTTHGSAVGDLIYGVNDGLGAVFGIVAGVSGYTGGSHVVLISGIAGMLASALSMGGGAYLAAKSEREVYTAEIAREKNEIQTQPEEELEELSLMYQLKGFSEAEAEALVKRISADPEQFLNTMAQEELGLAEANFPSPVKSMISGSLSTAVGAIVPVIPFFFLSGIDGIIAAFVVSLAAHFAVGSAKTILTAEKWYKSGFEMVLVGFIEAIITYGLGVAFHGAIAG